MSTGLRIGTGITLPVDYATETGGILAKKGAGKSNAAVVIAEELYDAGVPWVAVDPKGDWWGIRSSADGKGPGLPIVVFGGRHGDVPLEPTAGAMLADLVLAQRLTCVLDVSEFTKGETTRFLLAFAQRLFRQAESEPLHLFLEEAHEYLPQMVRNDQAEMVGAWQRIVKQGRFKGLGCTLVSQRSASLNKDVLTQVDTLIVLRTMSPQDRAAVKAWVDTHADAAAMLDTLPSLADGEAWLWSPEFLGRMERIKFRRRRTFDSGATPKVGQARKAPATLADVDLAAIKEQMADTIEKAKADDPKELRRRIAALERELRERPAAEPIEVEVVREVVPSQVAKAVSGVLRAVTAAMEGMTEARQLLASSLDALEQPAQAAVRTPPPKPTPHPVQTAPSEGLSKQAAAMLAELGRRHPMQVTEAQLSTMTGYSKRSSSWGPSLRELRTGGYVVPLNGHLTLTEDGLAVSGHSAAAPAGPDELVDMWVSKLPKQPGEMLRHYAADGGWVLHEVAAVALGYSLTSSSWDGSLRILAKNGLIERLTSAVRAVETLRA